MEMICIGFLGGALMAIIFVGIGVCFGRMDKGESSGDSDSCVHSDDSDWQSRSVVRHTAEEMIEVLHVFKLGACRYEREILNELIDMLEEGEEKDDNRGSSKSNDG